MSLAPSGTAATDLAPLAVAVPIVAAAAVAGIGRRLSRRSGGLVAVATGVAVLGLDLGLIVATGRGRVVTWGGGWGPGHGFIVGVALVVDRTGAGLATLVALLLLCALVYSQRYFEDTEAYYEPLMLLFLAGMEGFCLTGDLFDLFVFFELMGAAAYALTGMKIEETASVHGALNFAIVNSFGAYLSLCGLALLYAHTGQLGFAQMGHVLSGHRAGGVVVAGYVLVITGVLVKAAVVPFHFWLADAHAVAPTPVCVLFSGVMVELGLYAMARVTVVVFGGSFPSSDLHHLLLATGTVTAVVGAVMAFAQHHLKRLLAYSTISHVGLILVAFGTLAAAGTSGAELEVVGHALVKGALFLVAGIILNRYGSVDEIVLHGRGHRARVMPWVFLVGALALAGLPPFGLALGDAVAGSALLGSGVWTEVVSVGATALAGGAALRACLRIYFGLGPRPGGRPAQGEGSGSTQVDADINPEVGRPLSRTPLAMLVPTVVLLVLAAVAGLDRGFAHATWSAATSFLDRHSYITETLGGGVPHPQHLGPGPWWSVSGVLLDLLSVALAGALAVTACYAPALPAALRRAGTRLQVPVVVLRRLHSGHVGDYVAWLFVGVVWLAALVGLPLR